MARREASTITEIGARTGARRPGTALVHIGTHKTGTTAFQQWARRYHAELLELRDIKVYEGLYGVSHLEIPLLCVRTNRTMRPQRMLPESRLDEWREHTMRHVMAQVDNSAAGLLISAEDLSLLRYEDEVAALATLLSPRKLRVAVCLRDRTTFLESYRKEMERADERPSPYPSSSLYVEADTWLVRWDEMLSVWRSVLGRDNVVEFGYDDAVAHYGSSIPGVLESLSIDTRGLPSWDGFVSNVSATTPCSLRQPRTGAVPCDSQ